MGKCAVGYSLMYSENYIEKEQDINKLVKELSEIFKEVDNTLLKTIILAADGNKILSYNSLIFYTEGWDIYKQERLPLSIVLEPVTLKTSLENEIIYNQGNSQNDTNAAVKQIKFNSKTKEQVELSVPQGQPCQLGSES